MTQRRWLTRSKMVAWWAFGNAAWQPVSAGVAIMTTALVGAASTLVVQPPWPLVVLFLVGVFLVVVNLVGAGIRRFRVGRAPTPRDFPTNESLKAFYSQTEFVDQFISVGSWCWTKGEDAMHDATFIRCVIEGPAVFVRGAGVTIENPVFHGLTDADTLDSFVWAAAEGQRRIQGGVRLQNVRFLDCDFTGVSFVGTPEWVGAVRKFYNVKIGPLPKRQFANNPLVSASSDARVKRRNP